MLECKCERLQTTCLVMISDDMLNLKSWSVKESRVASQWTFFRICLAVFYVNISNHHVGSCWVTVIVYTQVIPLIWTGDNCFILIKTCGRVFTTEMRLFRGKVALQSIASTEKTPSECHFISSSILSKMPHSKHSTVVCVCVCFMLRSRAGVAHSGLRDDW